METNKKIGILEDKFNIPTTVELQEGLREMCNLSELILEQGIEQGIEQGKFDSVKNMIENGFSIEDACRILKVNIKDYEAYLVNVE